MTRYDVVVLDRDLPEVHGDDVCRAVLRRWQGSVRVLSSLVLSPRVGGGIVATEGFSSKSC